MKGPTIALNKYNLELDGRMAGALLRLEGPDKDGDLDLGCGAGMSRAFYDWLATAFSRTALRKSGAVYSSPPGPGSRRLEFFDALVAGVALPELDKSVKSAASMKVTLAAEQTKLVPSRPSAAARPVVRPWFVSDFKLQIDGLDADCKQVTGVGAVWARTTILKEWVGSSRFSVREPAGMGFSHLVIALPRDASHGFEQWSQDAVKGDFSNSKAGSLEYLAPGGGHAYFRIDFGGLDVVSLRTVSTVSKSETQIELASESMSFAAQPSACTG